MEVKEKTYQFGLNDVNLITKTKPAGPVQIQLIKDAAGFDQLKDEWDELTQKARGTTFQSFSWQNNWWHTFGDNKSLLLVAFRQNRKLVGLAPMYLDVQKIAGVPLCKTLRLIGSSLPSRLGGTPLPHISTSPFLDIISDPSYEKEVATMFLHFLHVAADLYDVVQLQETNEYSWIQRVLIPEKKKRGRGFSISQEATCPVLFIGTQTGFTKLDKLIVDCNMQLRRKIHELNQIIHGQNMFKVNLINSAEELEYYFPKVIELHQQSCDQSWVFGDDTYPNFLLTVLQDLLEKSQLWFSIVETKDNIVGFTICSRQGYNIFELMMAYDTSPGYAMYQPGNISRFFIINLAMQQGYHQYYFFNGNTGYRNGLTRNTTRNYSVHIDQPDSHGRTKRMMLKINRRLRRNRKFEKLKPV